MNTAMKSKSRTSRRTLSPSVIKKTTFLALEGVFFVVIAAIAHYRQVTFEPWFIFLFFLATMRAARTISFNEIAEGLREPFTEVKPDSCGAGANVHPKGTGVRYALGSLLACPICTGTWCALALFSLFVLYEPIGRTLVYVLAFAGGSELLHYLAEFLEWGGRLNRVEAGRISPDEE